MRLITPFLFLFLCSFCKAQDVIPLIQTGHSEKITAVTFTTSSEYFFSAGMDGQVLGWDINSRKQVFTLEGFTGGVSCIDYHEDSNLLIVGTYDQQVFLYDLDSSSYDPIQTFEFIYYATTVDISPDGKHIAMGSADYSLAIYSEGQLQTLHWNGDIMGMEFSPDSKTLYFGDYGGSILAYRLGDKLSSEMIEVVYSQKHNISDVTVSQDGKYLAFGTEGYEGGTLGVINLKRRKLIYSNTNYITYLQANFNSIQFIDPKNILYINSTGGINLLNTFWKRDQLYYKDNIEAHLSLSPNGKWMAIANSESPTVYLVNQNELSQRIEFKGMADKPVRMIGQFGDELLVEYESGIKKWDLEKLEVEMLREKLYEKDWKPHAYSSDLVLYSEGTIMYDIKGTGTIPYLNLEAYSARFGRISQDKRFYAYLSEGGEFGILDISILADDDEENDSNSFAGYTYSRIAASKVEEIVFSPFSSDVIALGEDLRVINFDRRKTWSFGRGQRTEGLNLPGIFFPPDSSFHSATYRIVYDTFPYENHQDYASEWRSIAIPNLSNGNLRYKNILNGTSSIWDVSKSVSNSYMIRSSWINSRAYISTMLYDSINEHLIYGYSDGSVRVFEYRDGGYYTVWEGRLTGNGLEQLLLSSDNRFLLLRMSSGVIYIYNYLNKNYICCLVALDNNEFLVMDYQGYYKRSKNTSDAVALYRGGQITRLSQFDKYYNRPHILMRELGLVGEDRLQLIEKLASKEEDVLLSIDSAALAENTPPVLRFIDEDKIDYTTSNKKVCIKTEVEAKSAKLDYMKIWVNGVPIYAEGEEPRSNQDKDGKWVEKWEIPLRYGSNAIRFVSYDENGIESNERIVTIDCQKKYKMPNLYIATISVSEYADSTMNLKYAVKDGRDFAEVFVQTNGEKTLGFPSRFANVYVDSFYNQNATRENIVQWRNKLMKANPDDYVLLYVSGHGLLDDSLNFWFATHDIDFDNPAQRGMSFEDLEYLLVGIPAQQKLFLMDACHSGEVIAEELTIDSTVYLPDGSRGMLMGYSYRGAEVFELDGETVNKSELKQTLFSNYESKSGATVISAAAGNSFALESPEWSNGIFTYVIIEAMLYRRADINDDGEVSVVELSRYVSGQVKERTDGMQIPNDRQENIDNNFRIW